MFFGFLAIWFLTGALIAIFWVWMSAKELNILLRIKKENISSDFSIITAFGPLFLAGISVFIILEFLKEIMNRPYRTFIKWMEGWYK